MSKKSTDSATLTLTITYQHMPFLDIIEAAKEVIEKATEQGSVEGYLDIHHTNPIPVEYLRG